ncbi:UNVERIFIED_ORG: DNA replication protein DnaC [Paraburkholderia sediminicola]|nr:DNA replication protein DnaC [Paraburkholderia sediminicola]
MGIEAVQRRDKRVRYFATVELTNVLELEKNAGKQCQIAHKLMRVDLLILGELGYLPFSQTGDALLDRVAHHCKNNKKESFKDDRR